jgi:hypothetical protein
VKERQLPKKKSVEEQLEESEDEESEDAHSEKDERFRALFFVGLNSEQLSFWNVQLAFLGCKRRFLIFRLCGRKKEFPTLLQLRKILLRTVSCTGVLPFVVNCQKVQYSTADWR